ncbi:hypothetical protein [Bacillus haynesii]|uniref:hypothetical protein n=1 Tax=Bacillus haynesii TaxID=1925021 RepID=UPI0035D65C47
MTWAIIPSVDIKRESGADLIICLEKLKGYWEDPCAEDVLYRPLCRRSRKRQKPAGFLSGKKGASSDTDTLR